MFLQNLIDKIMHRMQFDKDNQWWPPDHAPPPNETPEQTKKREAEQEKGRIYIEPRE